MDLSDHLFRHESGRMVATMTRIFGVHNLALAEDVVQDAFCRAVEVWKLRGIPDNPSAWLMATARNRALDILRRERTARTFAPELGKLLHSEWTMIPTVDELLEPGAIQDDQLRMMFSCCHPRISEEAQIALILHILCGFSTREVAAAFLTKPAAIDKRIWRAKKTLAETKTLFDITGKDVAKRLGAVQSALYLLFNEGYHGASPDHAIQADLCEEAIRLIDLLLVHPTGSTSSTYALAALMRLHVARLPARLDSEGRLRAFAEQDRSAWNRKRIDEGMHLLSKAAADPAQITIYHVEATIAAVHASADRVEDTDWATIVALYDTLMRLRPSPVVALGRAIAVGEHEGPERGLEELKVLAGDERLAPYPFYAAALGEMELKRGRSEAARAHLEAAISVSRNPTEREYLERRLEECVAE